MTQTFVTGGSGFVGRNLIRRLHADGHQVRALVRSDVAAQTVAELGAQAVRGDLHDITAMQDGMQGCEWVFHSAAKVEEWGDPADFHRINVIGTENLLAAARAAGVQRFVQVSTEAVLANGHPLTGIDETTPVPAKPLPRYPRTKALAEQRVRDANCAQMETVIVRPRMIWGADDTSLLPQIAEAVTSGRFVWVNGGRYPTSTTHVANVCDGLVLAAACGQPGETYFVTDGEPVELRSFLTELLATRGVTIPNKSMPHALAAAAAHSCDFIWDALRLSKPPPITRMVLRLFGEPVTISDIKARRELGYQGVITRAQGLAELG